MPDLHLYEYAVIRYVPFAHRQEFLNIGLIMFCKQQRYLHAQYTIVPHKLQCLHPQVDISFLSSNLHSYVAISSGSPAGGPIGLLDIAERFRWLTAVRSTTLRTSPVHPGYTHNLAATFGSLYQSLVL